MEDYLEWRHYHRTALQLMVRYYWKKYKFRQAEKKRKAKEKADALAKKKRSRTLAAPALDPIPSPTKGKKKKNVEVVATKDNNILNIISSEIKEKVDDKKDENEFD